MRHKRSRETNGPTDDGLSPILNICALDERLLLTRRTGILTALSFAVAACTETVTSFSQGIRTILADKNNAPVSRVEIASIPYATILAKTGSRNIGKIILGKVEGEDHYWYAGKKGVFIMRGGRVTKTVGLAANLTKTAYVNDDPLTNIIKLKEKAPVGSQVFNRVVDMTPPDRYGITISSTFELEGSEEIEIVELRFDTLRFVERCEAKGMDWSFENTYWVGRADGIIWRSVQHIHPDVPEFQFDILKPYVA